MANREETVLASIGSEPIAKAHRAPKLAAAAQSMQLKAWLRTRQTFVYHVCDRIAQGGWPGVQDEINEMQRQLENLYDTPMVELMNIYRRANTKNDGICMIAIFKIGPLEAVADAELRRVKPTWFRAWWERIARKNYIDPVLPRH